MKGELRTRAMQLGAALCAAMCVSSGSWAASWPQWRGPNRNGVTSEQSGWNGSSWEIEKKWQTTVGQGMGASPILVNGRVYVMGNVSGKERISCLNVHSNGAVLWYREYTQGVDPRYRNGESPEGPAGTPTFDPDTSYLYTLGIDGDLNCWDAADANGTNVWHINLYDTYGIDQRNSGSSTDPTRDYGYCGTPLLLGDNVVIEVGDEAAGNIMAFDKLTGARAWTSADKHDAGHNCGPMLMELDGTPCIASFTLEGLRVMRADSGREGENVAWFEWLMPYNVNCPSPAIHGNTIVLTSTAANSSGKTTTFLELSLTNGITNQWTGQRQAYICSPVVHEGYVYMVDMFLYCIEFETGNLVWEGGGLACENNGSLLVTGDDRVIAWGNNRLILAESAKNSPSNYVELANITGAISGGAPSCHPHVALAEGFILVKDKSGRLAAYGPKATDIAPPHVASAGAGESNRVTVVFDEAVDKASAETVSNYAINHGVVILDAVLGAGAKTVSLDCSPLCEGLTYVLTVNGVCDLAETPNVIAADSVTAFEYVSGAVQDGLRAHWPMDEGEGAAVEDVTGGGLDGSIGGAVWSTNGVYGSALDFDGSDDYVDVGTWSVSGTGLTVALWFRADDFGVADARLLSKATGTAEQDHYWMLSTITSGGTKLRFRLRTAGSTTTLIAGSGDLAVGEWTHAAIVYDGTAMKIYKDAVETASTARTGTLDTGDGVSVWIGNNPGGGKPFDGVIDDVRVYERALSASELEMVMQGAVYRCVDEDHDGMSDVWEELHFGSTTNSRGDAWADWDGDGQCNFHESQSGTDPTNASSVLKLSGIGSGSGSNVLVSWQSVSGRMYRVDTWTNLQFDTPGECLSNIPACPPVNTHTVTIDGAACRFYRIGLE